MLIAEERRSRKSSGEADNGGHVWYGRRWPWRTRPISSGKPEKSATSQDQKDLTRLTTEKALSHPAYFDTPLDSKEGGARGSALDDQRWAGGNCGRPMPRRRGQIANRSGEEGTSASMSCKEQRDFSGRTKSLEHQRSLQKGEEATCFKGDRKARRTSRAELRPLDKGKLVFRPARPQQTYNAASPPPHPQPTNPPPRTRLSQPYQTTDGKSRSGDGGGGRTPAGRTIQQPGRNRDRGEYIINSTAALLKGEDVER